MRKVVRYIHDTGFWILRTKNVPDESENADVDDVLRDTLRMEIVRKGAEPLVRVKTYRNNIDIFFRDAALLEAILACFVGKPFVVTQAIKALFLCGGDQCAVFYERGRTVMHPGEHSLDLI